MNIALLHFRVGETDGVSLEMEKWKIVLEEMGHKVCYIAGSGDIEDLVVIDELHYQNQTNDLLVNHIYKNHEDGISEEEIKKILEDYTKAIADSLIEVIKGNQIDLIIPNNVLSLGWNIAAGIAMSHVIEQTGVKVIAHHHDFHWERTLYSHPKYAWVEEILSTYFPPVDDCVDHVVINDLAKKAMKDRKGLDAEIVPNVFDYETEWMITDSYNKSIREDLGFSQSDIIILQGTRIVARKGIELTIRAISEMNSNIEHYNDRRLYSGKIINSEMRIKLVLVGLNEDPEYYRKLFSYAESLNVDLIDVGKRIDFERKTICNEKIFSLWDAYLLADVISYPSLLEGFGNQLLEAVYAKKPMLIYEYPVYESYIKVKGLQALSFTNQHSLLDNGLAIVDHVTNKKLAKDTLDLLIDEDRYREMVEWNYDICLKEFSFSKLKELLIKLVGSNK